MNKTLSKLIATGAVVVAMTGVGTKLLAEDGVSFSRNTPETARHFTAYWSPRASTTSVKDWKPIEQNKKGINDFILAKDYFKTIDLTCAPDHLFAYWNHNKDNPVDISMRGAAIISVFTAPADGAYSVTGTPAWRLTTFKDCRAALYKVAKVSAADDTVSILFEIELNEPGPAFTEPREIAGFKDNPKLQNIELKQGDKLAFILAASTVNYRGVRIDDATVAITR